jgi:hypothetical protein
MPDGDERKAARQTGAPNHMTVKRCVFCSGTPLTREHVLPRWLAQELPGRGEHLHTRGEESRRYIGDAFDVAAKCVCSSCNSGWMSRLESHARPVLRPLLGGRPGALDPFLQLPAATWAFKTALMVEKTTLGLSCVPDDFYADFFHQRIPAQACQIWLGAYDWRQENLVARYLSRVDKTHRLADGTPTSIDLFKLTLSIGCCMFNVLGRRDGAAAELNIEFGSLAPKLVRIWPLNFEVSWPPTGMLTHQEFEQLNVARRASA